MTTNSTAVAHRLFQQIPVRHCDWNALARSFHQHRRPYLDLHHDQRNGLEPAKKHSNRPEQIKRDERLGHTVVTAK
ncbi:hypothetical protein N9573_02800 [Octadecabacter sp.]|nr:hypothetical protein [Octadecabacter sp.]